MSDKPIYTKQIGEDLLYSLPAEDKIKITGNMTKQELANLYELMKTVPPLSEDVALKYQSQYQQTYPEVSAFQKMMQEKIAKTKASMLKDKYSMGQAAQTPPKNKLYILVVEIQLPETVTSEEVIEIYSKGQENPAPVNINGKIVQCKFTCLSIEEQDLTPIDGVNMGDDQPSKT